MKSKKTNKEKSSIELLLSKTKFQIYSYLEIYKELTSNTLEKVLKKSKSTIHSHIQDLIDIGIISPPNRRDSLGNIIYCLSPNCYEQLNNMDAEIDLSKPELSEKEMLKLLQIESAFAEIDQANNQILIDFCRKIENQAKKGLKKSTIDMLKEITKHKPFTKEEEKILMSKIQSGEYDTINMKSDYELLSSHNYLTKSEYQLFRGEWVKFILSIKKKTKEHLEKGIIKEETGEKKFLVSTTGIPIKRMLEFLNKNE